MIFEYPVRKIIEDNTFLFRGLDISVLNFIIILLKKNIVNLNGSTITVGLFCDKIWTNRYVIPSQILFSIILLMGDFIQKHKKK